MASIQRTLTWTGLLCNCYCSLPAFVPFWLPHIGNSSTFTGRSAWPIFAGWWQPIFLVEHAFELSVHNCSRWSFSIHWKCHYRSLGAVGIADTSIFQLVLTTNFQRQHGKVKLHKMPRPDFGAWDAQGQRKVFSLQLSSKWSKCQVTCHSRRSSLSSLLWCAWWTGQRVETTMNSGSFTPLTWDHLTLLARALKCRGCVPLAYSMLCMVQLWCNRKETKHHPVQGHSLFSLLPKTTYF